MPSHDAGKSSKSWQHNIPISPPGRWTCPIPPIGRISVPTSPVCRNRWPSWSTTPATPPRGALEDVSLEKIKRLFEVNLFALIRVTQACIPAMRKARSGIIVNVSSIVGKFAFPGSSVYAASKYAVEGISDGLRIELAPYGIRVVTIRPGAIATEFGQVAEQMTGDLLASTDPDYRLLYQTTKAAMEEIWADDPPSPPHLIADLVLQAVSTEAPKAVYAGGSKSDEFLGKRDELDDDGFYRYMMQRFHLSDLKTGSQT